MRKSAPRIDLTGQQFGRWTALEYVPPGKWKCQCSCENHTIKLVEGRNLRSGKSLSCGCLQKEKTAEANSKDYTGQRFGKLIALERIRENGITYYLCQCDCGNPPIMVDGRNLASGHTTSCGCIKSKGEMFISQILLSNNIKFEREKTYTDCKLSNSNQCLRFDFYLPDYDLLIEYDGEQHSQISRFGNKTIEEAQKDLEETQMRDRFKDEWCKNNNHKLKRISYKDYSKLSLDFILGGEDIGFSAT